MKRARPENEGEEEEEVLQVLEQRSPCCQWRRPCWSRYSNCCLWRTLGLHRWICPEGDCNLWRAPAGAPERLQPMGATHTKSEVKSEKEGAAESMLTILLILPCSTYGVKGRWCFNLSSFLTIQVRESS